jgi:hypothetical protein
MTSFNLLHFQFSILYLLITIISIFLVNDFIINNFIEIIIGFISFYLIHYTIFLNFFALAQRSISSAILTILSKENQLTFESLDRRYANGEGFSYIQNSRLEDMHKLGWIKKEKQGLRITKKGKLTIKIVTIILKMCGIKQIGSK